MSLVSNGFRNAIYNCCILKKKKKLKIIITSYREPSSVADPEHHFGTGKFKNFSMVVSLVTCNMIFGNAGYTDESIFCAKLCLNTAEFGTNVVTFWLRTS